MMTTVFSASGGFAVRAPKQPRSVLPIYSMGHQTQHLIDKQQHRRRSTYRVLCAFVIALTAALACAMLLLVSSGAAYAMTGVAAQAVVTDTGIAAAGLAIAASTLASVFVIRLSMRRAF